MTLRGTIALLVTAVALPLAACGEKAQTAAGKKSDAKPWEGMAQATHSADGYKAGDKAAWEAQLKARAERGQNEYTRTATTAAKP
jgi:outer membrane biogenesis lipoprotein LolB